MPVSGGVTNPGTMTHGTGGYYASFRFKARKGSMPPDGPTPTPPSTR